MSPYITFILSFISILLITTFTLNFAKKITDEKAMVKSVLEIELGLEEKVDQDSNKKNRNETVMVLGRRKYQEIKDKELKMIYKSGPKNFQKNLKKIKIEQEGVDKGWM